MIKFEDYLEKVSEKINWEIIDLKKNKKLFKAYKKCGKLPPIDSVCKMLDCEYYRNIIERKQELPLLAIPLYFIVEGISDGLCEKYPLELLNDYFELFFDLLGEICPYLDHPKRQYSYTKAYRLCEKKGLSFCREDVHGNYDILTGNPPRLIADHVVTATKAKDWVIAYVKIEIKPICEVPEISKFLRHKFTSQKLGVEF